ncbi:TPA: hypothetical protein KNG84_003446 [Serratia fonticola]|nr:hypothetical protein [Serratia fonticola]HBE9091378.1 hypothetical protein [Serratia fonticola]
MMANIYGVVAGHAAHHKGCSDFVQHTGPINSGQLRVSLSDAQTWYNSLRVEQADVSPISNRKKANPLIKPDCAETEQLSKSLMGLNYSELRELDNPLISSTPTNGGSWLNSLIISKTCTAVSRYNLLNVSGNAAGVCREIEHEQGESNV